MQIRIRDLTKRFGATPVLKSVTLDIADRELFFLLGPSGCGKSTLLRTIAGFYDPDGGELFFGDHRMNGVPPHRRNAGMVFQNYALWPHLTVAENVAYGLEVRGLAADEKRERVAEALRIVRMEPYAERSPNQLSGGQQQRVALARAIVIRPDVLLLDEPLSNLDARLRLEMREEIRRIHDATRITTLYVTHDQKEALSMADRMAVMRDGVVEQLGAPRTVYRRPASRFVADFIGEANWLPGIWGGDAGMPGQGTVTTAFGTLLVETGEGGPRFGAGKPVQVGFRPESVRFENGAGSGVEGGNVLAGRFESITYLGEIEQYTIRLGEGAVVKAFEQNPERVARVGEATRFRVDARHLFVLPAEA